MLYIVQLTLNCFLPLPAPLKLVHLSVWNMQAHKVPKVVSSFPAEHILCAFKC